MVATPCWEGDTTAGGCCDTTTAGDCGTTIGVICWTDCCGATIVIELECGYGGSWHCDGNIVVTTDLLAAGDTTNSSPCSRVPPFGVWVAIILLLLTGTITVVIFFGGCTIMLGVDTFTTFTFAATATNPCVDCFLETAGRVGCAGGHFLLLALLDIIMDTPWSIAVRKVSKFLRNHFFESKSPKVGVVVNTDAKLILTRSFSSKRVLVHSK
jgi:hypothetical protein